MQEPHDNDTPKPPSKMLDYNGVAMLTGLKLGTLYALVSQRRIPHVRLSKRLVRFPQDEIERWLAAHLVPVAAPSSLAMPRWLTGESKPPLGQRPIRSQSS